MLKRVEELKKRLREIPADKWDKYISKTGYEVPPLYLEKLKAYEGKEIPDKLLKKAMIKGGYHFPSKRLQRLKAKAGTAFPKHVGLIIDGNRRWAQKRGLDRNAGHFAGYKTLRKMVFEHYDLEIRYLSIYTLSLENIKNRDPEEIDYLYSLVLKLCDDILNERDQKNEKIKFNVFGRMTVLPQHVREKLEELIEKTKNNTDYYINLCIDLGIDEKISNLFSPPSDIVPSENKITLSPKLSETLTENDLLTDQPSSLGLTRAPVNLGVFLIWKDPFSL